MSPAEPDELEELESWIAHILSLGYTPGQVRVFLKEKGADKSDVDKVFDKINKKSKDHPVKVPSSRPDDAVDLKGVDLPPEPPKRPGKTGSVKTGRKLPGLSFFSQRKYTVPVIVVLLVVSCLIYGVYYNYIPIRHYDCHDALVESCNDLTDDPRILGFCLSLGERYNNTVSEIIYENMHIPIKTNNIENNYHEAYGFVLLNDQSYCWYNTLKANNVSFEVRYKSLIVFIDNVTEKRFHYSLLS